jgi:hypothetical protein
MDSALLNEINLLEENKKKIDSRAVYDLMIHSIKGKYICEEQRKNFVLNRVLPNQKMYDPSFIEPQAKEFVDCYANMVGLTKSKCQDKYKNIYECLIKNHKTSNDFPVKCVAEMEDFINC